LHAAALGSYGPDTTNVPYTIFVDSASGTVSNSTAADIIYGSVGMAANTGNGAAVTLSSAAAQPESNNVDVTFQAATWTQEVNGSSNTTFTTAANVTLDSGATLAANSHQTVSVSSGDTLAISSTSGVGGALTGDVTDNGAVTFTGFHTTYGGVISGQGAIDATGMSLTFSQEQTNTGGMALSGSTVALDGQLSNENVSVDSSSILELGGSSSYTYAGVISGAGKVKYETGGSSVTATSLQTYTGETVIASGAGLILARSGGLASNVTDNGSLTFDEASYTYDYVVSGAGSVNVGNGSAASSITFASSQAYSGNTTVEALSTLTLSGGTTFVVSDGSTLTVNGTLNDNGTITNSGTIGGSGTYNEYGTLSNFGTLPNAVGGTGSVNFYNTSYVYAGAIGGGCSVNIGNGSTTTTITFDGANTYTGTTALDSGTLWLNSSGALGGTSEISFDGGTLQATSNNSTDYSSLFSTLPDQEYSINTCGTNVTWATPLTSVGGTLSVFDSEGFGSLTLTGANTYTGVTTVNTAGALGAASLRLDLTGTSVYPEGVTIGGGTVTLDFTGTNSYAGPLTINGGAATLESQDGSSTYSGSITYPTNANGQAAGALVIEPGVTLWNNSLTVPPGATLSLRPGSNTIDDGSTATTLDLPQGSTFDMTDGQIGTFAIDPSGSALTIQGATFGFDLGSTGGDCLEVNGAASVSGTNIVNIAALGTGLTSSTYNLITASSGLAGTFEFVGGNTSAYVTLGSEVYELQLQSTATAVTVTVSDYGAAPAATSLIQTAALNTNGVDLTTGSLTWSTDDDAAANYTTPPVSGCYSTPGATTYGQIVVFGMTVTPATTNSTKPTGWVDFDDATNPLKPIKLDTSIIDVAGYAAFRTAALSVGTHIIEALYSGDANYGPSTATTSINVNQGATVYYVSPGGSDGNSGMSFSQPLETLAAAYQKLYEQSQPGGTIYMESGTYDPNDGPGGSLGYKNSFGNWDLGGGSAGSPITIAAYPGATVNWDFGEQFTTWAALQTFPDGKTNAPTVGLYEVDVADTFVTSQPCTPTVIDPDGYVATGAATESTFCQATTGPRSWYDSANGDLYYIPAESLTNPNTQLNVRSKVSQIDYTGQYISLLGINVQNAYFGSHWNANHFAVEDDSFESCGQGILGGGYDALIQNNYIVKTGGPGTDLDHDIYTSGNNETIANNFCGESYGDGIQCYNGDTGLGLTNSLIANDVVFDNAGAGVLLEGYNNRITGVTSIDNRYDGICLYAFEWNNEIDHCYLEGAECVIDANTTSCAATPPGNPGFQIIDNTINDASCSEPPATATYTQISDYPLYVTGDAATNAVVHGNTYVNPFNTGWSVNWGQTMSFAATSFNQGKDNYLAEIASYGYNWDQVGSQYVASGQTFTNAEPTLYSEMADDPVWLGAPNVLTAYAASVVTSPALAGAAPVSEGTLTPPVAIEGTQFKQTIFHFCDDNSNDNISSYTATITLGDGNTLKVNSGGVISGPTGASGGIVADPTGGFNVWLQYTYTVPIYVYSGATFQVQVTTAGGRPTSASVADFSLA